VKYRFFLLFICFLYIITQKCINASDFALIIVGYNDNMFALFLLRKGTHFLSLIFYPSSFSLLILVYYLCFVRQYKSELVACNIK
jgi:hypothetical protein